MLSLSPTAAKQTNVFYDFGIGMRYSATSPDGRGSTLPLRLYHGDSGRSPDRRSRLRTEHVTICAMTATIMQARTPHPNVALPYMQGRSRHRRTDNGADPYIVAAAS